MKLFEGTFFKTMSGVIGNRAMVFLLAAPVFGHAGNESSGGGNAIVCFNSKEIPVEVRANKGKVQDSHIEKITSIEMLDLWELKKLGDIDSDLTHPWIDIKENENPTAFALRVISRVQKVFPTLYDGLLVSRQKLSLDQAIRAEHGLGPIDDHDMKALIDHENCVVATVLRADDMGQAAELHFDPRLFNHALHSPLSKGIGVLHEIIYKFGRSFNHKTSLNSRRLLRSFMLQKTTYWDFLETARNNFFDFEFITSNYTNLVYVNSDYYNSGHPWRRKITRTWSYPSPYNQPTWEVPDQIGHTLNHFSAVLSKADPHQRVSIFKNELSPELDRLTYLSEAQRNTIKSRIVKFLGLTLEYEVVAFDGFSLNFESGFPPLPIN